jgi:4-amino-4-deoxy-L-arabinose transferase-like glycosyltransferase
MAPPPGLLRRAACSWITFWPACAARRHGGTPAVWRAKWRDARRPVPAGLAGAGLARVRRRCITKLPHYVLPLYPAIAILLARAIETGQMSPTKWMEWGTFWWFAVPVVIFVGSLVLLVHYEGDLGWRAWPFLAAAIVFGFRAWWLYDIDGIERSLLRASVTTLLLSIAVYWSVIPALAAVFPSVAIQRTIHATGCANPRIAAAGYHEPSMVFLSGTDTALTNAARSADFLKGGDECRFAVIETSLERTFARRAEAIGLRYGQVGRFDGYSLGSGGRVSLKIYRSRGDQ